MPERASHREAESEESLLEISGTVQGVGFRPFLARLAARLGLRGWVRNDERGVMVRAIGRPSELARFSRQVRRQLPVAARMRSLRWRPVQPAEELPPLPESGFVIVPSRAGSVDRALAISPDRALCPACRRELNAPGDRRHAYPFINCTDCGPRYSIVENLPYDRARTTMAAFTMCPACAREFATPEGRRFHAQPNACPRCGPQVALQDGAGRVLARRGSAIAAAAAVIRRGGILALQGLGGFHLMVDATNDTAVRELRQRKSREAKPLAVMFPSLAAIRRCAILRRAEVEQLRSAAAPIVIVRRRAGAVIADAIAPGNPGLGVLLPYTPLHVLLLAAVRRPVVATSGNRAEEPLCTGAAEARARLGAIASRFLVHDRRIANAVDDSVVRFAGTRRVMVRRARGFAPAAWRLPRDAGAPDALLCVGAQLKNTIAVAGGRDLVLSPHLGDLGNPITRAAFHRTVRLFGKLLARKFARVACDFHPAYASTQYAESLGLPVVRVQHHLAHILSCLLEHGGGPARVLGVAWDGTGDGGDGTIWGGEFILVDRVARTARRVGHLRPFRLAGGETAVREPRRSAFGVLAQLPLGSKGGHEAVESALGFNGPEGAVLGQAIRRGLNAPVTTSAGRLFDAAAALLGLRTRCSFEGQAAMEVEFAAAAARTAAAPWPMPIEAGTGGTLQIDWRPAMTALLDGRRRNPDSPTLLAARFHASLVRAILRLAREVAVETVVLTGGCFQNTVLLGQTADALGRAGFRVLRHRDLPPNDGGIAAGQALGAGWGLVAVTTNAGAISDGRQQPD